MRFLQTKILFFSAVSLLILASCSNASFEKKSPAHPDLMKSDMPALLEIDDAHNRSPIAVYEAVIDPDAETFTINPVTRDVQYHYPLTELFPNCLQVVDYGYEPNFWADIKLVHPVQGTGIDFFDPRVIAIVPAHWDAYFHYPTLGVYGNPKVVLEPDGYTKLFNELAPDIFGNVNPFVAYFKDVPYRRWSSTGQTEETKRWEMDYDGFGGDFRFMLVVDVSTNYPNPPNPRIDNAREPEGIKAEVGAGLTQLGGDADISVTLHDWQGVQTIGGVKVEAPDLFDGTVSLEYSEHGADPDEYIYTGTIRNDKLAPLGEYWFIVTAWSKTTGIYIYQEFTVEVTYQSTEGYLIWAKSAGGEHMDEAYAITTLSDDSIVISGRFVEEAIFGKGEPNETILTAVLRSNMFIAKYNPDGTLAWARRDGGAGGITVYAISTLSDDSIVMTGGFGGPTTFGEGDPNEITLDSVSHHDIFIAKYNSDSTLAWAKTGCGSGTDRSYGIATLSDDSAVITGSFCHSITFGEGEPNETTLTTEGWVYPDIFVARYNPDGTLAWVKSAKGMLGNEGYRVTALSDDSVIITGYVSSYAKFGEGEPNETELRANYSIFIARYNPDGTLAWVKLTGGNVTEWSNDYNLGYVVTALSDDSFVVTGHFRYSTVFGQDEPNETILTSERFEDFFIARYDPDGSLQWVKSGGGPGYAFGMSVTALSDNSTVATGLFSSTATFGKDEPNETTLTSVGGWDVLLAKYSPDGSLQWAKSAGGIDYDRANGIASLSDDSSVIVGGFVYSATFGKDEPNETTLTAIWYNVYDIFIARYEP